VVPRRYAIGSPVPGGWVFVTPLIVTPQGSPQKGGEHAAICWNVTPYVLDPLPLPDFVPGFEDRYQEVSSKVPTDPTATTTRMTTTTVVVPIARMWECMILVKVQGQF
jgi:hypothetical protein